jgi:hypothetical protein
VNNPREDWATKTAAAAQTHKEATIRALNEGRFERGVREAGSEKWKKNAISKGVERWGPGVNAAGDDYQSGMEKVISAIETVTLPPRYPAGDERNLQRVAAVNKAVHAKLKGK